MLSTVKFHNHPALRATEIDDETTNGMLTPELNPVQLSGTKTRPYPALGFGVVTTKLPGTLYTHAKSPPHPSLSPLGRGKHD